MEDDFTEYVILFLKDSIFRERGSDREREGEEHHVAASHAPPTGHLARNPGMCPDWELNQWPFGTQADTQSTEPHQQGVSLQSSTESYFGAKICSYDLHWLWLP